MLGLKVTQHRGSLFLFRDQNAQILPVHMFEKVFLVLTEHYDDINEASMTS